MSNSPLETAGATREPSEYATITMDRQITGLWTQRSPLRDADVPYLYGKFYSASRFDSLFDGVNRELTAKLTGARRAGSSIYNSNSFPAINSFYSYQRINNGQNIVRVIADGQDGVIYDATAGQKSTIFTKSGGAGKARFQGVNTSLYFTDGVENMNWMQPATWLAQTSVATSTYAVGTTVIDSNGSLEYLFSMKVGTITNVVLTANVATLQFSTTNFFITQGMTFVPSGLTGATFLNWQTLIALSVVLSGGIYFVTVNFAHAPYTSTPDSGTVATQDVGTIATTGNTQPTWATGLGFFTADGLSTWLLIHGSPVINWGMATPTGQLSVAPASAYGAHLKFWQPTTNYAVADVLLDSNGFIQFNEITSAVSGSTLPKFQTPAQAIGGGGGGVLDGTAFWFPAQWMGNPSQSVGSPAPWKATTSTNGTSVIVDSNGNLQFSTTPGTTGGAAPTFNTTYGGTTNDGSVVWTNYGPYLGFTLLGWKYAYCYQSVDGSVSNMSIISQSTNGVIGPVSLTGNYSTDKQNVNVLVFRTPSNGSTPLLLARLQNITFSGTWNFIDQFPDSCLNPFIPGPSTNAPPPIGMTAPIYHLGRIFGIYNNTVICSGGPNILVGNGNTSFNPNNQFPIPEQPIRLFSGVSSQGPAVFVWGTSNIWIILGAGTVNSPFQQATKYMDNVGVLSYDAIVKVGSTFHAMLGNNKVCSLDPGAGYTEIGFPIGDQFKSVTTGAGGKIPNTSAPLGAIYNPASAFVAWAELGSGDTAVYICDGSIGWFRYAPIASPESGYLWSPRAILQCGSSAVQGIETTTGILQLLIGPVAGGSGNVTVGGAGNLIVTWTSGTKFNLGWAGKSITIGGTPFTIASVQSQVQLTLTSAGAPGSAAYSVAAGGPILFRDSSVNADWVGGLGAYQSYPSYDVKGNIVLCQSGEIAEIAHIGLKSTAQGARPVVGLLLGELAPTQDTPFDWLDITSTDPPILPKSETMYSDRYVAEQNGVCPKCDNFQLAIDYGTQNFPDEMLLFSIYGAKHSERKQQ